MKLVKLPVLPPNGPDGQFFTDCEGVDSYPKGTETHGFINPLTVSCILPHSRPPWPEACIISFYGSPIPQVFATSAEKAHDIIQRSGQS